MSCALRSPGEMGIKRQTTLIEIFRLIFDHLESVGEFESGVAVLIE